MKKEWKATPVNHFEPVPKSKTGKGDLVHNGTRKEMKTPPTHFAPTPKSATGRGMLAHNGTRTETMTSNSHFRPIDKSCPEVPVEPKSWKRKGYSMGMNE